MGKDTEEFQKSVERVMKINEKLKAKGCNYQDIDAFWANVFRVTKACELSNIKICTGCGYLIAQSETEKHYENCTENNYKTFKENE